MANAVNWNTIKILLFWKTMVKLFQAFIVYFRDRACFHIVPSYNRFLSSNLDWYTQGIVNDDANFAFYWILDTV